MSQLEPSEERQPPPGPAQGKRGGGVDGTVTLTAILTVLVVLVIIVVWNAHRAGEGYRGSRKKAKAPAARAREGMAVSPDAMAYDDSPERRSVYGSLSRLYSTADVDPLITGQLYDYSDGIRDVYAQRTSHGDGLAEYSSSGGPGDVGVDIGPIGLDEYGGKEVGYDDGIPEQWAMPSTPIRWYAPKQRDHYGPQGPTPYSEGLYTLAEPDHVPLMN